MEIEKPRIFIASSSEGLNVAYAVQTLLDRNAECTVWDQGIFVPTSDVLSDLLSLLENTDYGIFVFSADDVTNIRNNITSTVRDNVVLELGLFMGALGRMNCFILCPNFQSNKLHLPTDLTGVTTLKYNPNRKDGNIVAALGPSVNSIRKVITKEYNTQPKKLSKDLIAQINSIGLSAFFSSRDDYTKYRTNATSIDEYITKAESSIVMVSITLSTGMTFDNVCTVFKSKLENYQDFRITVSLLNPYNDNLYAAIKPQFEPTASTLQSNAINSLETLVKVRNSLDINARKRFVIKVHQTLPFGSAIILDGETKNGTIQIETKPYGFGMRQSFAFQLENNGGYFYNTLLESYRKLVNDGIDYSNLRKDFNHV